MTYNPLENISSPKISRTFNYNSSGSDVGQSRQTQKEDVKNPISISNPLSISDRFGMFDMRENIVSVAKDQLKMILLTNKGERVGNYEFGANIRALLFSQSEADVEELMIQSIQDNVLKYMPYARLISFNLYSSDELNELNENEILIEILFSLDALNVQSSIEVIFSGG
jgi:phage baseplate assembly protein W